MHLMKKEKNDEQQQQPHRVLFYWHEKANAGSILV